MYPSVVEVERLLRPTKSVVEFGPGIHPQAQYASGSYLAIEPYEGYVKELNNKGLIVLQATALRALPLLSFVDTFLLIDVLEHMPKPEGRYILQQCLSKARQQIAVFTPLGFQEQSYKPGEKDAWGMNGTYWQTHRSGWIPEDFPGWTIGVSPDFHGQGKGALYAIWEASRVQ